MQFYFLTGSTGWAGFSGTKKNYPDNPAESPPLVWRVDPVKINAVSHGEITMDPKPRFRYWGWGFVF
jgi:hypothetical protein